MNDALFQITSCTVSFSLLYSPHQSHLRICPVKEQEREGMSPALLPHQTEEKPSVHQVSKRAENGKKAAAYRVKGTDLIGTGLDEESSYRAG